MSQVRNVWGGSFEITPIVPSTTNDNGDHDKGAYGRSVREGEKEEEEVTALKQSWLLRPDKESDRKKRRKAYVDMLMVRTLLVVLALAGLITLVVMVVTRHRQHHPVTGPDNYTLALRRALMFFNAQRSGTLPMHNNVSWRGNSCLRDGELAGGYFDGGSAAKYSFPASFTMTLLSWSVIEYSAKYEAAGELDHVKDIIKWGTEYLLKTFNSSADSIGSVVAQIGGEHDLYCWVRPEDIDDDSTYPRQPTQCYNCPALAAEMAAALAAASVVFKDSEKYSKRLVHGAQTLFTFATKDQGENYAGGADPPSTLYNSTGFWDEFVWGGAWLYFATGNSSYLKLVTTPDLAKKDPAFWGGPNLEAFSWDKKLAGAQLLLSRVRIFLGYGYPYEEMLSTFQNNMEYVMCSYLPVFSNFNRTKGGLIQLNHGKPQPLQYVVNAAFLATLFSDYLEARKIQAWNCGSKAYMTKALRDFARTQIDYILGKNPQHMSYMVGFGDHFPQQVHHQGASIPNNVRPHCKDGWKWRDIQKPNPHIIVGAMVAGPDKWDGFHDVRSNYTEPTTAGNAGLVAALVALSGERTIKLDVNSIFYAIPPLLRHGP